MHIFPFIWLPLPPVPSSLVFTLWTQAAHIIHSPQYRLGVWFFIAVLSASVCLDLPPPPEPPPEEDRLQGPAGCMEAGHVAGGALSSLEKREPSSCSLQRKGSGPRQTDSKMKLLFSSKHRNSVIIWFRVSRIKFSVEGACASWN